MGTNHISIPGLCFIMSRLVLNMIPPLKKSILNNAVDAPRFFVSEFIVFHLYRQPLGVVDWIYGCKYSIYICCIYIQSLAKSRENHVMLEYTSATKMESDRSVSFYWQLMCNYAFIIYLPDPVTRFNRQVSSLEHLVCPLQRYCVL